MQNFKRGPAHIKFEDEQTQNIKSKLDHLSNNNTSLVEPTKEAIYSMQKQKFEAKNYDKHIYA